MQEETHIEVPQVQPFGHVQEIVWVGSMLHGFWMVVGGSVTGGQGTGGGGGQSRR